MKYPKINWVSSFPEGELDNGKASKTKILLVGIDTEYTEHFKGENLCLSYQLAVFNSFTGELRTTIYYPDLKNEVRLRFSELLVLVFQLMDIKAENISGYYVNFICHFCSAELSMLRDREHVSKSLDYLYKTVVTLKPSEITFEYSKDYTCTVGFDVRDTILLLPPTHRSLEKATSLLSKKYHKKELTANEKENMLLLLRSDPERFEDYAIADALCALALYIKLQSTLNLFNKSESTLFTTIGNATVKHFINGMDRTLYLSQFSSSNELYQKGLNLANRAYMGGLNSSYFIGIRKGELFLDIDFSSAYPTCMNLLEVSDFGEAPVKAKDEVFSLGVVS